LTNPVLLLVGDSETNQNLYYKTSFLAGDPFVYVENGDRRLMVITPFEQGRAKQESSTSEVRTFDDYGHTELVRELGDRSKAWSTMVRRIVKEFGDSATVEGSFPVHLADSLRSQGVALEVDPQLLMLERRRKSDEQVAAIAEAQQATERAMTQAISILAASEVHLGVLHYNGIPLTSERLRSEVELSLTRDGMDPGTPVIAAGPGAADPHWKGAGPIQPGDSVVLDIFPRSKTTRYFADCTRTVVRGEPRPELAAMYDAVFHAQEAALREIRAGTNGKNVHEAVLAVFREAGYEREEGPKFIHSTGHGVGLNIHEGPGLGISDVELLEGDVVTVEPGLYDSQVGAIRIEDLVVVTKDGYRNLTQLPKEFEV
jgi:Xaa-Pro aminopeptidase